MIKVRESFDNQLCSMDLSLEIHDFNVIVEVVHLCGGKHRLIPSPIANEQKKAASNVLKFVRT